MVRLAEFRKLLHAAHAVYVETNILIYHLEDRQPYAQLTEALFEAIEAGRVQGHTSVLSLLEINVQPYKLGQVDRALTYLTLIKNLPNFFIHDLDLEMADLAASLRAKYNLKTPDAIHLACSLKSHCDLLVGNDDDLNRVKEIRYGYLNNFI